MQVRVQFAIELDLVVDRLPSHSFFDPFKEVLSPPKRIVVPWHSQTMTILACRRSFTAATTNLLSNALSRNVLLEAVQDKIMMTIIKVSRQIAVPLNVTAEVLVTTTAPEASVDTTSLFVFSSS